MHGRFSRASPAALWAAAQAVRVRETQVLGRLLRWRIPGTSPDLTYDEMFRSAPFTVLEEGSCHLLSGLVGRIWTLRRDYPRLGDPAEFRAWSKRGTARVLFATWTQPAPDGACLCSETRVETFGAQGRLGVATVRPLVRASQHRIGSEGIAAAVRRAEKQGAGPPLS